MINRLKIIVLISFWIVFLPLDSFCFETVEIGPKETIIKSSIKYSVIGKYNAVFDEYTGQISLDWKNKEINGVQLNIDAASIQSQCGWCDKIVRSKQLLHVDQHPKIVFKSREIEKNSNGYDVMGDLYFHGVVKQLTFPFKITAIEEDHSGWLQINAKGQWTFNRKDFKVIWSRLLDHGGVLVGDDITVEWEVNIANSI